MAIDVQADLDFGLARRAINTPNGIKNGDSVSMMQLLRNAPLYGTSFAKLLTLFAESEHGESLRAIGDPVDAYDSVIPLLNFRREAWMDAGPGTTSWSFKGFQTPTAVGTPTSRTPADGSVISMLKGINHPSTGTAGTLGGTRIPTVHCKIGGGNPGGGFVCYAKYGFTDAVSGARQFVGLRSSTSAPTNVNPNTLTNSIGFGADGSGANMKLFYGGSAAQTPIDLGSNFPATTANQVYEQLIISLWDIPNAFAYFLGNVSTGLAIGGVLSGLTAGTQLPASSTLLTPVQAWRTNNATASAVTLVLSQFILYTPF